MRTFKLGTEFPHEGFVQSAIEVHFSSLGFALDTNTLVDLSCAHSLTGERWVIEAKGVTSDVGLDFRTGLGQLVQRMSDASTKYGIAIPEEQRFLKQCGSVSTWVRQQLGLYWIVVSRDGTVRMIAPTEQL